VYVDTITVSIHPAIREHTEQERIIIVITISSIHLYIQAVYLFISNKGILYSNT
jgi:hypothetical protein